MNFTEPFVSIRIPNYNYGKYMRYCLDSVLAQTYDNFEVIIRDNASTDDSYEIALEYQKKFKERDIYCSVVQNKRNVGSDNNSEYTGRNCSDSTITYVLASDDAIKPDFLKKTVSVFERFPSVGMVMTNREEIDDEGRIYEIPPFYNKSCVVSGEDQAAVFMMAGIAIPGQRILRRGHMSKVIKYKRTCTVAGDWLGNFLFSLDNDIAYIAEPLCQYRVHPGNETNVSERNLTGVFEHFLLINDFTRMSKWIGYQKPAARYDEAVRKLGGMCLRYAFKMLKADRRDIAKKYLNLAPVFEPAILRKREYIELLRLAECTYEKILPELESMERGMQRTVSYDPPKNYIEL